MKIIDDTGKTQKVSLKHSQGNVKIKVQHHVSHL